MSAGEGRLISETVTYENVWLSRGSGENLKVYVGGAYQGICG